MASPLERAVAVVLTPPQPEPGLGADLPASHTRCINGSARWVLSGAKPGNGIECLMDDSVSGMLKQSRSGDSSPSVDPITRLEWLHSVNKGRAGRGSLAFPVLGCARRASRPCLAPSSWHSRPQLETWWQSDGKAPHTAQAVFDRRTTVVGVALFVEFGVDESYTPNKVSRARPSPQRECSATGPICRCGDGPWCAR